MKNVERPEGNEFFLGGGSSENEPILHLANPGQ